MIGIPIPMRMRMKMINELLPFEDLEQNTTSAPQPTAEV